MSTTVQSNSAISDDIVTSRQGTQSETGTDQVSVQESKKSKFPGFNLYIKNLDDSFTDVTLREVFDSFGTITSAKVMCDVTGKSKGFGFVCFTTKEEANAAVTKMNGRIVGTKPLYVAMAQKKEERKQYLNTKYKNLVSNANVHRPPVVMQPTVHVREPIPASFVPGSNSVNAPMLLRSVTNSDARNSNPAGITYVMAANPPMTTYMPIYPLYMLPNVNVVRQPPPAQLPVLHQPIYLHSSKANALIYSTGVQTNPSQMPVPGVQVYTSSPSNVGGRPTGVHTISAKDMPAKQNELYNLQDNSIETLLAQDVQNKAIVSSDMANEEFNYQISRGAKDGMS